MVITRQQYQPPHSHLITSPSHINASSMQDVSALALHNTGTHESMHTENNYLKEQVNVSEKIQDISETSHSIINSSDELEIRVEGIPSTGAKSRVETQIKLSIQLASKSGAKIPCWSYLRISESMLVKSKLRKSQQQKSLNGVTAAMVSDESKVLDLEARVVCESDETKKIKMCYGCVRRERKRAERKKYIKRSNYNSKLPDKEFEQERQRVLIFNCEPLINFATGEASLPTRITCYCRHHNENIGFRVRFTVKNSQGVIVATGDSPPVMITDDHKNFRPIESSSSVTSSPQKRRRASSTYSQKDFDTPSFSDKNSIVASEVNVDTASSMLPLWVNPSSEEDLFYHASPNQMQENSNYETSSPNSPSTPPAAWTDVLDEYPCDPLLVSNSFQQHDIPHFSSYHTVTQVNEFDDDTHLPRHRQRRCVEEPLPTEVCHPSLLTIENVLEMNEVSPLQNQVYPLTYNDSTPTLPSLATSPTQLSFQDDCQAIPILDSIYPCEGLVFGGNEVCLKGQGFHGDLTPMFGNRAATVISWSPDCINCILPPAADKNDCALVSFKAHSLIIPNNSPPLFTYHEPNMKDLLDFTLQMVGLYADINTVTFHENQAHALEVKIIHTLSQHCCNTSMLLQTNMGGQTLLHLAAYFDMVNLIDYLVSQNPTLLHCQDLNGLSPLHFACQNKSTHAIGTLVNLEANVASMSSVGTAMDIVANSLNPMELQLMKKQVQQGGTLLDVQQETAVEWLPSVFVYASIRYHEQAISPKHLTTITLLHSQLQ